MADYIPTEIVDMIMTVGECHGNLTAAADLYAVRFPNRRHPTRRTITNLIMRARNGQLHRRRASHKYNQDDVRVLIILAIIHLNPHISTRNLARQTQIPQRTIVRILEKQNYHAYHITLTQALQPADFIARVHFCQWALGQIQQDPNFFNYVLFSDEATFKNDGQLNRHNSHYWSDTNPHWYRSIDHQHRWSVMVWCGIVNGYLVGPYFFDGNVTGQSFLKLLRDHLPLLLENVDLETRQRMWLQLDGAGPHYANIVRNYLNVRFHSR